MGLHTGPASGVSTEAVDLIWGGTLNTYNHIIGKGGWATGIFQKNLNKEYKKKIRRLKILLQTCLFAEQSLIFLISQNIILKSMITHCML